MPSCNSDGVRGIIYVTCDPQYDKNSPTLVKCANNQVVEVPVLDDAIPEGTHGRQCVDDFAVIPVDVVQRCYDRINQDSARDVT